MASYGYYVERQGWTHWPKVLIMWHRTGLGPDETRRYVPERKAARVRVPRKDYMQLGHYECGGCGTTVGLQDAFCRHCGARLEGTDE